MKLSISNEKGVDITKGMMGLFFEDINYGADGGLYAEMIENRSFEFLKTTGVNPDMYASKYDGGYGWYERPAGTAFVAMDYVTENPLTEENPHYLHLHTAKEECGFANKAYDGIFLKKGAKYNFTFFMNKFDYDGIVRVQVRKDKDVYLSCDIDCGKIAWNTGASAPELKRAEEPKLMAVDYRSSTASTGNSASASESSTARGTASNSANCVSGTSACDGNSASNSVNCASNDAPESVSAAPFFKVTDMHDGWKRYEFTLTSQVDLKAGEFTILLSKPGTVDFDFISVIPADAVYGVFRKDLLECLKEIHPGFLRFPGGCVIEGNGLANRYQWKLSVGDVTRRKANWNRWSVHDNGDRNNFTSKFPHYNQTLGIGYYEYFLLCEYLGAKAVPVVNVGLACQYMSKQLVKTDDPKFMEFVNDAIDLIEFANGGADTKWGALRCEMGHPQPFGLELLGIGNEQWETEEVDFFKRYTIFEENIHAKYPEIKLIGSAGPDVHTERYDAAWKFYHENAGKENFVYSVDEHYYMSPEWFVANTHFYDEYPRDVKVFSGEYAAHPRREAGMSSRNTLEGAVAEAAFLTGVERNADVVVMSSYAPLLAREGYVQWAPDMVWFNAETVYGSPSYYVQKMFANHTGDYTLKSTLPGGEERKIFVSVSYNKNDGETIVKLVNASDEAQEIELECEKEIKQGAKLCCLTGNDKRAYNTSVNPLRVAPCKKELGAEELKKLYAPANSVSVYRIK
ncbi:MAG: hypothetical protein K6B75_05740 [Lachnospiraceae bacterium]|nr:hypothetical protein [Lachnospiraceae bacterium]